MQFSWLTLVLVASGGSIGAAARYLTFVGAASLWHTAPSYFGVALANSIGCLIFGGYLALIKYGAQTLESSLPLFGFFNSDAVATTATTATTTTAGGTSPLSAIFVLGILGSYTTLSAALGLLTAASNASSQSGSALNPWLIVLFWTIFVPLLCGYIAYYLAYYLTYLGGTHSVT